MAPAYKSTDAPKGLIFMATDAQGRLAAENRKTIRSHVMRGKNTGRGFARRSRHSAESGTCAKSRSTDEGQQCSPEDEVDLFIRKAFSNEYVAPEGLGKFYPRWELFSIPRTCHDLTLVQFCEELDSASVGKIIYYCSMIKKIIYPVEWCCSLDPPNTVFFEWMLADPAYLHVTLYTVSLFLDVVSGRKPQRATNYHLYRTIKALKSRIGDVDEALTDATAAVIMSLAMVAECFGDLPSAATHSHGLRRIVELRGGITTFKHNNELYSKIRRVDFGHALSTGEKPAFSCDMMSYGPFFRSSPELSAFQLESAPGFTKLRSTVRSLDAKLGTVLQDLHDFSQLANSMFETGQKIQPKILHELMTSVQYRLLSLHYGPDRSLAELLRLSLLAYLSTLFLRVPGVRLPFHFLGEQMQLALRSFDPMTEEENQLYMWCLIVGAISVLPDHEEVGVQKTLLAMFAARPGMTWSDAQDNLREVAWINATHSDAGAKVVSQVLGGSTTLL